MDGRARLPHSGVAARASGRLHGDLTYEPCPYTAAVEAVVAAELIDGRFTIVTDEPHVKVAWRFSAWRPHVRPERSDVGELGMGNS